MQPKHSWATHRNRFLGLLAVALSVTATPSHAVLLWGSTGFVGGGSLFTIDTVSQTVTSIGSSGLGALGGIAFDASGVLYGVSGGSAGPAVLWTLSTVDATPTLVGAVTGISGVDALTFDSGGTLWGGGWNASLSRGVLVTIDKTTGALLTSVTMSGSGNDFCPGLDFDASGQLYGSRGNSGGHLEDLVSIDTATGVHTAIGGATAVISDILFGSDGTLYGSGTNGFLYSIDPSTGAKTFLFATGIASLSDLAQGPSAIPEPTSLLLIGSGLLGVRLFRRRRS